ncbi:MAG: transaldolase family protein [Pseudomonadota bacterium]|nr:transaldolase family protein [Pseudomonadota bacterium]
MKIFLDTAEVDQIVDGYKTGLVDGVTTNPTLILRSGRQQLDVIEEIYQACPNLESISAEVVAETADEMIEQAQPYIDFSDIVTIKVPCTREGLKACYELSNDGILTNVTLVFSTSQAILAAKAGATYVSPFVGRVDDNSFGGLCLVKDIANTYKRHDVETQILAASIRNVRDVGRAFEYGANVCTIPVKVFDKMYDHVLTREGLELFNNDYLAAKKGT